MPLDRRWQSEMMNGVQASDVREHLARMTASSLFSGAGRLRRFLEFTVESALDGRSDQVKEYVVGREVYDRDEQYDTRLDPIVRVEARRLRARLLEYYDGPGLNEPIRLEYPKGQYVPVVRHAGPPLEANGRSTWRSISLLVGSSAFAVAIAVATWYVVPRLMQPSTIAPIPASWIQRPATGADPVDVDLAEAIDVELARDRNVSVLAWPEIQERMVRSDDLRAVAERFGVSELMYILVRESDRSSRASIFLMAEPSGRKRLAFTYYDPALATPRDVARLAHRIAADFTRAAK